MKSSSEYIFSALSLIVLCLCSTVAQAKGKTDWDEDGLKGEVKEMRVYNVHETTSGIEKAFIRHKIKYDKKGNRLEEEHYNENDEKKEPITYIYKYNSKKDRLFKYKYKYRYDTNINRIRICQSVKSCNHLLFLVHEFILMNEYRHGIDTGRNMFE